MPRASRIKLITGLSISIFGLLLAFVVAPIFAFAFMHTIPQGRIGQVEEYAAFAENLRHLYQVYSVLTIGGLGLATLFAIYSFVVFAIWFIGPPEKK